MYTNDTALASAEHRQALVDSVQARPTTVHRSLVLVNHRLLSRTQKDAVQGDLLLLMSSIIRKSKLSFNGDQVLALKPFVFQLASIKHYASNVIGEKGRLGMSENVLL